MSFASVACKIIQRQQRGPAMDHSSTKNDQKWQTITIDNYLLYCYDDCR
jgi:hypothetical protein